MKPFDYRLHNREAWNRMARSGNRFARPAAESDLNDPLASVDGPGWLGPDITGKRLLCLAAGGGRQGPIYATAGAEVTVFDISPEMLELDHQLAKKLNLNLRMVEGSMDDLSMFADGYFDIVIQPVSTCYVPNVHVVFGEVARVTAAGGIYVSQHKQPVSLQASLQPGSEGYFFQYGHRRQSPLPTLEQKSLVREPGAAEFIHGWSDLLGGMCRAGFSIEDLSEPDHADPSAAPGSFKHRSVYVPPYVRVKAVRKEFKIQSKSAIWSPV